VEAYCKTVDKSKPLTRELTREMAETVLKNARSGRIVPRLHDGDAHQRVLARSGRGAIPFHRRLMLLPHCLKNAEGRLSGPSTTNSASTARSAARVKSATFRTKAEELGYKVLVSEGTPIVLKIIVSGHIDAIVGVACLNVLEKAFDKVLLAGIPCIATPLLSSNCKNTSVDNDWVFESIGLHTPPAGAGKPKRTCTPDAGRKRDVRGTRTLAPRAAPRGPAAPETDPLRKHENIAYDFLGRGGKRSRPFIHARGLRRPQGRPGHARRDRLGAFARRGDDETCGRRHRDVSQGEPRSRRHRGRRRLPLRVTRTLHRVHGVGTAINVGDYLIGLGYRCVSRDRKALGAETARGRPR